MHSSPVRPQRHSLVILTLQNFDFSRRPQSQSFQKLQKLPILLVNTKNFRVLVRTQIRKQYRTLTPQLRHTTPHGNAVGTRLLVAKTLLQERLNFRRDPMFQPLCFVMRLSPGKPNHFRKQHLRKLVTQGQSLGNHPPFPCQIDPPSPIHPHMSIPRHALQSRGYRWGRHLQLLRQPRANRSLILLKHLPNCLEVILLRNAGFLSPQTRISPMQVIAACFPFRGRFPSQRCYPP